MLENLLHSVDIAAAAKGAVAWMAEPARLDSLSRDDSVPIAFAMATTFEAGALFVKTLSDVIAAVKRSGGTGGVPAKYGTFSATQLAQLAKVDLRFAASSNAGSALMLALGGSNPYETRENGTSVMRRYGAGMLIASPVPDPQSGQTGVVDYRTHLQRYAESLPEEQRAAVVPGPFSLEAYLSAALLGEAFKKHGRDLTTESFIDTLETLQGVQLGIGIDFSFSALSHQASTQLWGQQVDEDLSLKPLGLLLPH